MDEKVNVIECPECSNLIKKTCLNRHRRERHNVYQRKLVDENILQNKNKMEIEVRKIIFTTYPVAVKKLTNFK